MKGSIIIQILPIIGILVVGIESMRLDINMKRLKNEWLKSLQKEIMLKSIMIHKSDEIEGLAIYDNCLQKEIKHDMKIILNSNYKLAIFNCMEPQAINYIMEPTNDFIQNK